MADDEQQQTLVSSETLNCNDVTPDGDKKEDEIPAETYIYEEAPPGSEVGQDILQQALEEVENVVESNIQQETVTEYGGNSEAQNLLNTLTGESEIVDSNEEVSNISSHVDQFTTEGQAIVSESIQLPDESVDNNLDDGSKSPKTTKPLPLGSSQNPIHIVQQGNTYHSSQELSKNQLQQIAQVLQKQQIIEALKNGGSSVVYNPHTNTRIVYRVVTPSEAQSKNVNVFNKQSGISLLRNPGNSVTATPPVKRGRGRPRKDGTVATPSPAPSRGRGRGRGRPARVDEDYSTEPQEKLSKEELELRKKQRPRTRSGRISKPPSYMVKAYKRIHPLDYHDEEVDENSDGGYSDYELSEEGEENSNMSSNLANDEISDKKADELSPTIGDIDDDSKSEVKTPKHRGRPRLSEAERSLKRKTKLKEAMNGCTASEINDVVLPKIFTEIPAWDYILQKSSQESDLDVGHMYSIFETVFSNVKRCFVNNLQQITDSNEKSSNIIKVEDVDMSAIFGVEAGKYAIIDREAIDRQTSESLKRSRSDPFDEQQPSAKRLKLDWGSSINLESGVDLSISEVPGEEEGDENKVIGDEPTHENSNIDIVPENNMEVVSIGPISDSQDETIAFITDNVNGSLQAKNEGDMVNESAAVEHQTLFTDDKNSDLPTEQSVETQIQTSEVIQQTAEVDETVENIRAAVEEHQASNEVQMAELDIPQTTIAMDHQVTNTVVDSNGIVSEPQTVTLLMDNKEDEKQYVTHDQDVVGVIEQPEGEDQVTETSVTTESLLGYLGEQLSAEALQPGNIVIIQNPDGTTTTVALSGTEGKEIPMETVQALLAMDPTTRQQLE